MNLKRQINLSTFSNIEKSIYKDNPLNRKLGRVGQEYDINNKIKDFDIKIENTLTNFNILLLNNNKNIGEVISFKDKENKNIDLSQIHINNKYRNQGLGTLLLKNFINEVKKIKEFTNITLTVDALENEDTNDEVKKWENNSKLIKMYQKEGFNYLNEKEKYILNPKMILMLK